MEQRIIDFCGQWTVPLITSSPPAFLHVSLNTEREVCALCRKKRSSIRLTQLVIFRDYVGTGLTLSFVNQGAVSHYERAPSYTLVLPKMCGTCEDLIIDVIAAQNFPRAFQVTCEQLQSCLLDELVDIVNEYMKLEDPFFSVN